MLEFLLLNLAYIYLGKQNREKHNCYSCNFDQRIPMKILFDYSTVLSLNNLKIPWVFQKRFFTKM